MQKGAAILMLAWLCACAPRVHVRYSQEGLEPAGETLVATFDISPAIITTAIKNYGNEPALILWHESSLVFDGETLEIMRDADGRGLLAARDFTGEDYSPIGPGATLNQIIYPRRSLAFADDEVLVGTFLPVECGPFRCKFRENLVGKVLQINIAVRSGGVDRTLSSNFRILSATWSTRCSRPDDWVE